MMTRRMLGREILGVASVAAAGWMSFGCGNASNPDAVRQDELKRPYGLTITDTGNGSVTLQWYGSNNEDKFDGYSIYGMKGAQKDLGVTAGQALDLMDDGGNANPDTKTILNGFNYNPD